jgi:hypothetical protein
MKSLQSRLVEVVVAKKEEGIGSREGTKETNTVPPILKLGLTTLSPSQLRGCERHLVGIHNENLIYRPHLPKTTWCFY